MNESHKNSMNSPRCIIFDFGNVIAFFDHDKACKQLSMLSDKKLSEEQVQAICQKIFKGDIEQDYDKGRIHTSDFRKTLRSLFVIPDTVPDSDLDLAWSDIFSANQPVIDLILRLRAMSYRLVLASNTNELHHQFFEKEFGGVLQNFDHLVLSYVAGTRKPDDGFYRDCLKASRANRPSQCVFVDDIKGYVDQARTNGMKGIHYVSVDALCMRLAELGVPLVSPKGENAKEQLESNLSIYCEKYKNWRHFDSLRWQVPGVVFASAAVILGFGRGGNIPPAWWVFILYGWFVLLCALLMYRIGYNIKRNHKTLCAAAVGIGDYSLPKPPKLLSASNWVVGFLTLLGIASVTAGIWLRL